jgi:hypothetical protein
VTLRLSILCLGALAGLAAGCREEPAPPPAAASAADQIVQSSADALQRAREAAEKSLNPTGLPLYSGAIGAVRGRVTISGDAPPLVPEMVAKLPAEGCPRAHELHRKLYRQGAERTLADVLVTVTEYQGYIRPATDVVRVEMKGCAFDGRVLAMTFGQRFDVFNLDAQPYMPRLAGTPSYALRVAMPGGRPVPILAPRAGEYMLVEETRDYMRADVYVLNYPTFDVTGLDGEFQISGIPVGDVKVTVYAPALGKIVERRLKLESGDNPLAPFEIVFSASEFEQAMRSRSAAPAPAAQTPPAPATLH